MLFQCFGILQVRENAISLCNTSGGTAQLHTFEGTLSMGTRKITS